MELKGKPSLHNPSYVAVDLGASSGGVIAVQVIDRRLQLFEVTRFSNSRFRYQGRAYECWNIDAIEEHSGSCRDGIARSVSRLLPQSEPTGFGTDCSQMDDRSR